MNEFHNEEEALIETRHLVYTGPPARASVLTQMLRHADVNVTSVGPYDYQDEPDAEPQVVVEIVTAGVIEDLMKAVEHFLARAKGAEVSVGPAMTTPEDFTYGNVRIITWRR